MFKPRPDDSNPHAKLPKRRLANSPESIKTLKRLILYSKKDDSIKLPLFNHQVLNGLQSISDATGRINATIPANTFDGLFTLELSLVTVFEAGSPLREAGRSFRLKVLEWLHDQNNPPPIPPQRAETASQLPRPITLTVEYGDADILHLDESQLALALWDDDQTMWRPLTSTVDTSSNTVVASSAYLGEFDLQAPLMCPAEGGQLF